MHLIIRKKKVQSPDCLSTNISDCKILEVGQPNVEIILQCHELLKNKKKICETAPPVGMKLNYSR